MNTSHYDSIPEFPVKRRTKRAIWYVVAIGAGVAVAVATYLPQIAKLAVLTGIVSVFTYVYLNWRMSSESDR